MSDQNTIKVPKYWRNKSSLKTIHITGYKWFDSVNGNTYCASEVVVNKGLKNQFYFNVAFTYGYGCYYEQVALECIQRIEVLSSFTKNSSGMISYASLRDAGVLIETSVYENCKKRELKALGGVSVSLVKRGAL